MVADGSEWKGYLRGEAYVFLASVLFGTMGFLQAVAPQGATPYVVGTSQTLVGGIALFAWLALRRELPNLRSWSFPCLAACTIAMAAFQILFFVGLTKTGVTVSTVVTISTTPIASALLAWGFLRVKPSPRWYPATAVAVAGLFLINHAADFSLDPFAMLYPVVSGFLYATFLVFSPLVAPRERPEAVTMVVAILCSMVLMPYLISYPTDWIWSPRGLFVVLMLGLGIEAFAFSLLVAGLRRIPAATAATISLTEPLTAAILGICVLNEQCGFLTLMGIGLIGVAIVMLSTEHPKQ